MDTARGDSTDAHRGIGLSGLLRAPFRRRTYRNLLYLLLQFPLGVAYFTVLVTAGAFAYAGGTMTAQVVPGVLGQTGPGGVPLLIALLVLAVLVPTALLLGGLGLAGLLFGGTALMTVHRVLTGFVLNVDLPSHVADVSPRDEPIAYLRAFLTDPGTYLSSVLTLATFPIGVGLFVLIVVPTTLAGALIAAPLLYDAPRTNLTVSLPESLQFSLVDAFHTVDAGVAFSSGVVTVDTLPEALVAAGVGVVVLLAAFNLFNAVAWLLATATRAACRHARVFAVGTGE
jgi:hypothetical protein